MWLKCLCSYSHADLHITVLIIFPFAAPSHHMVVSLNTTHTTNTGPVLMGPWEEFILTDQSGLRKCFYFSTQFYKQCKLTDRHEELCIKFKAEKSQGLIFSEISSTTSFTYYSSHMIHSEYQAMILVLVVKDCILKNSFFLGNKMK